MLPDGASGWFASFISSLSKALVYYTYMMVFVLDPSNITCLRSRGGGFYI